MYYLAVYVTLQVIGLVREKDIAVLKLELTSEQQAALKPVTLGSSSNLLVSGQVVSST
jgi:S1-C subfamily serine protease